LSSLAPHLYQEDLYLIQHPVVIILTEPWHRILESDQALLVKILGSVRINIDAVLIVAQREISAESVATFNSGKVLVFGSRGLDQLRPYEISNVSGVSVIKADALNTLDDAAKKSLWMALKQMFPL
jgi:hypothetical protein